MPAAYDVVFVIADGLSARAVQTHARPVLARVLPRCAPSGWRIAPLVVVRHGRVAIGDAIASALRAEIVVMLIGERPGLSAPDSMGAYLTWRAERRRRTDAEPQLHLQHPARGHRLRRCRLQARCICCAPCARAGSRACGSRTTPTGWRSRRGEWRRKLEYGAPEMRPHILAAATNMDAS